MFEEKSGDEELQSRGESKGYFLNVYCVFLKDWLLRLDCDEPGSSNGLIEATVRLSTWLPYIQVWIDEQQLLMGYDKSPPSRLRLDPDLTLPNTIMVTIMW